MSGIWIHLERFDFVDLCHYLAVFITVKLVKNMEFQSSASHVGC